jgi:hypothetical protein
MCQLSDLHSRDENHHLAFDGASVDSEISKIRQKLLSAVLTEHQFEKFWCVIDELQKEIKM